MQTALATPDRFVVDTSLTTGFHTVVDTLTGEYGRSYPLKKTANRAARQANEAAQGGAPNLDNVDPADHPLPTQVDIEDIALTGQRDVLDDLIDEAMAEDAQPAAAPVIDISKHPVPVIPPISPTPNVPVTETREAWLLAAAVMIGQVLDMKADLQLPAYRVTCGWPSQAAKSTKNRRIGECWTPDASGDGHAEIFITPLEAAPMKVVAILAHELIHAALPKGTGHKAPFVKAALAIGFTKPVTKISTTPELEAWTQEVVDALPAYPHAAMSLSAEGAKKPQVNRQLLAKCEQVWEGTDCGYQTRLARKWIVEVGAPICPRCNVQMVADLGDEKPAELPEGEGED